MADVKKARKAAEKAALDALSGTLVGSAGDLGAALAAQQDAIESIKAAHRKADALLEAARREGDQLIAAAEEAAATAATEFAQAWQKAARLGGLRRSYARWDTPRRHRQRAARRPSRARPQP